MDDLIIQSDWLLFDYIKPCLVPCPKVNIEPIMCETFSHYKVFSAIQAYDVNIIFHANVNAGFDKKFGIYQAMMELLHGHRALSSITEIFKNGGEYEIPLRVVQNMILAGKLTKDECIKAFSEDECYEALVELLQFDAGENQEERFDL